MTLFGRVMPKLVLLGLAGVIAMYVSVAGIVSVTTPWWVRGDTKEHMDYTWRLWHGHIPTWSDGIQYQPFVKMTGFKIETASVNPPLFYMIHAPVVGPIMDSGHWQAAIAVGRSLNIFLGVIAAAVLSWAGWVFGGKRRGLFAVAVPALSVLLFRFTRLNVDYALDALLVMFSTLSLILDYKILKNGLNKRNGSALVLVSVLGMSTKAPYIVFLLGSLLALFVATWQRDKTAAWQRFLKSCIWPAALVILIAVTIGWFYYFRNYRLNHNWFSSLPSKYGRPHMSLHKVLTNKKLWQMWYENFSTYARVSILMSTVGLVGWLTLRPKMTKNYLKNSVNIWMSGILLLMLLGTFLTQIKFAIGGGSINFRYILPAVLPISLIFSFGLLGFKWLRGQAVTLVAVGMGASSLLYVGHLHKIFNLASVNSVPRGITLMLLILFPLGAALMAWSLWAQTKTN